MVQLLYIYIYVNVEDYLATSNITPQWPEYSEIYDGTNRITLLGLGMHICTHIHTYTYVHTCIHICVCIYIAGIKLLTIKGESHHDNIKA